MTANFASDANFQTFNSAIDTAILAMGWVHSSDTGQMNPASANRAGISTYAGYIIYKPADALQATSPFFLKIQFGQAATATMYQLSLQVGTSTNGAGTLTGNISTAIAVIPTATAGPANCYFSGSTNRLMIALFPQTANAQCIFVFERDKDASGADTANGMNIVGYSMSNAFFQQFVPLQSIGPVSAYESKACTMISSQASQASGGVTGVGVIRPVYGSLRNPIISMLIVARADWTTEVTNSVTIYGASNTYLALTTSGILASAGVANNTACGSMVIFQ